MVWEGQVNTSAQYGGRHGGLVKLEGAMVPPRIRFTFDGAGDSPDLEMRFEVRNGRPECVAMTVEAKEGGRGIRTADLTVFNVDAMTVNVFAEYAVPVGKPRSTVPTTEDDLRTVHREVDESRRSRRGPSDLELQQVAKVYREHVHSSPTRMVAELCDYTPRTAARRVAQAREAGYLPPTTPGKRKA